ELAHLQQILDGGALAGKPGFGLAAGDRYDIKIQVVGKPLVESQLLLAEVLACIQRGEIEEAEVHRLLDLVGEGAGQDDPGDVRLDDLEGLYRMRVEGGVLQRGNQGLAHGLSFSSTVGFGAHYGGCDRPCKP